MCQHLREIQLSLLHDPMDDQSCFRLKRIKSYCQNIGAFSHARGHSLFSELKEQACLLVGLFANTCFYAWKHSIRDSLSCSILPSRKVVRKSVALTNSITGSSQHPPPQNLHERPNWFKVIHHLILINVKKIIIGSR